MMRFLLRSLCSLLLAIGAVAPATAHAPDEAPTPDTGAVALAPDADARWVPFTLTPGNQVRFTLSLDGAPVSAVLDTGVSFSVLARRWVDERHLPVTAAGDATAIGGAVPVGWATTRTLAFGGLARAGGRVAVAALPALATGSATPVDLLVGRDLLGTVALDIDYAERRFRLLPSGRLPFAGSSAPLSISRQRLYETRLAIAGRPVAPVIVDTGDGAALTLSDAAWRVAAPVGVRTTSAIAYGIAGPIVSTVAVLPGVTLGGLVAREVEVRVEPAGGFSDVIGVAGRLGSAFLQRYRVLLDPRAGRMVLSPGPDADRAPVRSTSGLLLALETDRLKVLHVMRNGPAEAAGWRAGDTICSVDGHPITPAYASDGLAAWSAGAPGRVVRLGLCDGTARPLTLASFY